MYIHLLWSFTYYMSLFSSELVLLILTLCSCWCSCFRLRQLFIIRNDLWTQVKSYRHRGLLMFIILISCVSKCWMWSYELSIYFQADGEDELKKRQLMELAIINGTYRDSSSKNAGTLQKLILCIFFFFSLFSNSVMSWIPISHLA